MSTNKTTNFGLSQWQSTDPIRVADFNADNQKLDAALAARAQLATGSYTGTGKFGSANPNTLTFPFEPKFVFVTSQNGSIYAKFMAIKDMPEVQTYSSFIGSDYIDHVSLAWSTNKLQWYAEKSAYFQLNDSGETYFYIAIG